MAVKHGCKFLELRLTQAELKFNIRGSNDENGVESYRIFLSSDNGFRLQTHLYREVIENQMTVLRSYGDYHGPVSGLSTNKAYTTKELLQLHGTLLKVPNVLMFMIVLQWGTRNFGHKNPGKT